MELIERDCTVEHNGQKFEAGGAYVVSDRALVYISDSGGRVTSTDWHDKPLGEVMAHEIGARRWGKHSSYRMAYVKVRLNGKVWWGRYNYDRGQAVRLRPMK